MKTQTPTQYARTNRIKPRKWYKGSAPPPGRSSIQRRFSRNPCPECHQLKEIGIQHECKPVAETQYKAKGNYTYVQRETDPPTHGY